MLKHPTYTGQTHNVQATLLGEHQGFVDRGVFEAAQQEFAALRTSLTIRQKRTATMDERGTNLRSLWAVRTPDEHERLKSRIHTLSLLSLPLFRERSSKCEGNNSGVNELERFVRQILVAVDDSNSELSLAFLKRWSYLKDREHRLLLPRLVHRVVYYHLLGKITSKMHDDIVKILYRIVNGNEISS